MRISLIFLSLFFFLVSLSTWAKGKVTTLDYKTQGNVAVVSIGVEGEWSGTPELTVKDKIVQVALSDAFVWPKIDKRVGTGAQETTLTAYQFDKENVRVRAILEHAISERDAHKVSVVMGNNNLEIRYPIASEQSTAAAPVAKKAAAAKGVDAQKYDESYLEKLLEDNEKAAPTVPEAKTVATNFFDEEVKTPANEAVKVDAVNQVQAAPTSEGGGFKLDMMSYIGKFVAFLGIILALFYGAVVGLRKGVFKKGKLNFLNSPKAIELLNTTYIAPKRSMMLVRVGKQVFLVGSSENGLHMMGEVDAPAGLLKEEEQTVTGTNFDLKLGGENNNEREFNLKEDITKSSDASETSSALGNFLSGEKDRVRLSDQIKSKVKSLKSLQ